MNYSGNMPDWHQYNPPQAGRTTTSSASSSSSSSTSVQNANNNMYIPGSSPPAALDGINLTNERTRNVTKHSNETSYLPVRNYPIVPTSIHMSANHTSCVAPHYVPTTTRNPMMENLQPIGIPPTVINDEVTNSALHRSSQMSFVPPTNANPPIVANSASSMHSVPLVTQNSPLDSVSPGRPGIPVVPSYGTCKAPCCNPDPNHYQHWEKFPPYPNATYRENLRQSTSYHHGNIDTRRFMPPDIRKDCHDNKEVIDPVAYPSDHHHRGRGTFTDYPKYGRKDSVVTRNYPGNNLVHQNYPMQSYQFPADYQKCPYTSKDYPRRGVTNNSSVTGNSGASKMPNIMKYHDQQQQQQSVIVQQQKYQHSKQLQYQNPSTNPGLLPNSVGSTNNILPNSYFNPNHSVRDYSRDYTSQDPAIVANRMAQTSTSSHVHGSFQKYHVYHQKIAMQRFTLENHLRAFARIPGYQQHPKYQECVMRYRELLRLQQNVDYQNIIQETSPKVSSPLSAVPTAAGTTVPPINLQFDQNGLLINSNYCPTSSSYGTTIPASSSIAGSTNDSSCETSSATSGNPEHFENRHFSEQTNNERIPEHSGKLINHDNDPLRDENPARYYTENDKRDDANYQQTTREPDDCGGCENLDNQRIVVDDELEKTKTSVLTTETTTATTASLDYQNSKDFADKPELDVRQFLANWDESEDEESSAAAQTILNVTDVIVDEELVEKETLPNDLSSEEKNDNDKAENIDDTLMKEKQQEEAIEINETELTLKNIRAIECVRSDDDMDDIPTIHIVENLDADGTEIEQIHTVFGNLAAAVLEPISIVDEPRVIEEIGETNNETETIVLFEEREICTKSLEETSNNAAESETNLENEATEQNTDKPEISGKNPSVISEEIAAAIISPTTEATTTTTTTTNTNSEATITSDKSLCSSDSPETTSLRKQNSFTSDESHNPDDISLPDLQTSECTPISTTLNTPIQSDSEESSEHVSDLTISTNPIEIIQNSPIISFTHSPIKIEPYEQARMIGRRVNETVDREQEQQHASLDFDFDEEVASNENRKYNENCDSSTESVVEELENQARDSMYEKRAAANERLTRENSEKTDDYYRDPLVGMAPLTSPAGDKTRNLEIGNNDDSNVIDQDKCPMIESENVDDDDDDFNRSDDLEKLCDMSLDDNCIIPLIPEDDCNEPMMPVSPIETNDLTKILNDTIPIGDLHLLETTHNRTNDKTNDLWNSVNDIDDTFRTTENIEVVESVETIRTKKLYKISKPTKVITRMEKIKDKDFSYDETGDNEISKDFEDNAENEGISSPLTGEFCEDKEDETRKMQIEDSTNLDDKETVDDSTDLEETRKKQIKNLSRSVDDKETFDNSPDSTNETIKRQNNDTTKINYDSKETSDNSRDSNDERKISDTTKSYTGKHRHIDSNVEIQLANFNLKIHNETDSLINDFTKNKKETIVDGVDAIEIKINLSRGDVARRMTKLHEEKFNDQEIKRKKNSLGKLRCRKRRRSLPESTNDSAMKRLRKNNDDEIGLPRKIFKHRKNRKIRKSMDDKLLLACEERMSENSASSCDQQFFHDITMKKLHQQWVRDVNPEIQDLQTQWPIIDNEDLDDEDEKIEKQNVDELKKLTTRINVDFERLEKYKDSCRLPSPSLENSSTLDFDNFDVAPNFDNESEKIAKYEHEKRYNRDKLRHDDCEKYRNPTNYGNIESFNYFDEFTSNDALERNLNTVPIYTTKDGRIKYSPNRNYTYRALIIEAKKREKRLFAMRKINYTRTRNSYRDSTFLRKLSKTTSNSGRKLDEKKSRERTISRTSSKTSSTSMRRDYFDDTAERQSNRTRKNDNLRNLSGETRVTTLNLENYRNDDKTMRSDCLNSGKTRTCLKTDKSLENCVDFQDKEAKNLHSENSDPLNLKNIEKSNFTKVITKNSLTMQDSAKSPKNPFENNQENEIPMKIFNVQELEISTRQMENSANCNESIMETERSDSRLRFFQETSQTIEKTGQNVIMASPSTFQVEKRSQMWEFDCQTALSDSGLESSTTYVEARKETRKIQKWKNTFVDRMENAKSLFSISREKKDDESSMSYVEREERKIEDHNFPSLMENHVEIEKSRMIEDRDFPSLMEKHVEIERSRNIEDFPSLRENHGEIEKSRNIEDHNFSSLRENHVEIENTRNIEHHYFPTLMENRVEMEKSSKIEDHNFPSLRENHGEMEKSRNIEHHYFPTLIENRVEMEKSSEIEDHNFPSLRENHGEMEKSRKIEHHYFPTLIENRVEMEKSSKIEDHNFPSLRENHVEFERSRNTEDHNFPSSRENHVEMEKSSKIEDHNFSSLRENHVEIERSRKTEDHNFSSTKENHVEIEKSRKIKDHYFPTLIEKREEMEKSSNIEDHNFPSLRENHVEIETSRDTEDHNFPSLRENHVEIETSRDTEDHNFPSWRENHEEMERSRKIENHNFPTMMENHVEIERSSKIEDHNFPTLIGNHVEIERSRKTKDHKFPPSRENHVEMEKSKKIKDHYFPTSIENRVEMEKSSKIEDHNFPSLRENHEEMERSKNIEDHNFPTSMENHVEIERSSKIEDHNLPSLRENHEEMERSRNIEDHNFPTSMENHVEIERSSIIEDHNFPSSRENHVEMERSRKIEDHNFPTLMENHVEIEISRKTKDHNFPSSRENHVKMEKSRKIKDHYFPTSMENHVEIERSSKIEDPNFPSLMENHLKIERSRKTKDHNFPSSRETHVEMEKSSNIEDPNFPTLMENHLKIERSRKPKDHNFPSMENHVEMEKSSKIKDHNFPILMENHMEIERSSNIEDFPSLRENHVEIERSINIEDHNFPSLMENHPKTSKSSIKLPSKIIIDEPNEKIAKPLENFEKISPKKITPVKNPEISEIVESLDLAITQRNIDDTSRKKKRRRKKDEKTNDRTKKMEKSSREISFRRCVSNDDGEFSELYFQEPSIIRSNVMTKICQESLDYESVSLVSETKNLDENYDMNTLESANLQQTCKDYLVDTCTSFSSCMKRLPETRDALQSKYSEISQLDDTRTRFAGESMDFNEIYQNNDDNTKMENFTYSNDQTLTNSSNIERSEIINLKDSFLARIEENANDSSNHVDCSLKSNDSDQSKDSVKAPILSFSGQIQSDTSIIDSSTKSPPDLTIENHSSEENLMQSSIENIEINRDIVHPKIPKMIIRNYRSRPATPTLIEEKCNDSQIEKSTNIDEKSCTRENSVETKIPKMKIKLEDNNLTRILLDNTSLHDDKRIKIKKSCKTASKLYDDNDKLSLVGKLSRQSSENEAIKNINENTDNSYKFTLVEKSTSKSHRHRSRSREKSSKNHHHHHHHNNHHNQHRSKSREKSFDESKHDKIPKLTIKKRSNHGTTNHTKKRRSPSPMNQLKKKKITSTDKHTTCKKDDTKISDKRRNSLDSNDDSNTAEKVPKVIIKRTSPSAEFKCELSKNDRDAIIKDSKWQPEVKLRRLWVLDCMAKEPGNGQVALKVLESTMGDDVDNEIFSPKSKSRKTSWNRKSMDSLDKREKISYDVKMRRKSDCDVKERNFEILKNRRKSFESDNIEFSNQTNNSKNIEDNDNFEFSQKSENSNDKEITDSTMKKSSKLNEDKMENTSKKSLKKSQDIYDENNSVIKLDSSDESQTTIEILPASLENSQNCLETTNQFFTNNENMGKLYSDEAIPTQFELELEIVDNSTIDSLDLTIPACSKSQSKNVENYENDNVTIKADCEKFVKEKSVVIDKKNFNDETMNSGRKNICCSDSLVKEVLAAKETLKRCLITKSKNIKPRPKTAAEKKQGLSRDYVNDITEYSDNWNDENDKRIFHKSDIVKLRNDDLTNERKKTNDRRTEKRKNDKSSGRQSELSWNKNEKRSNETKNCDLRKMENFGENSRTKIGKTMRKHSSSKDERKCNEEITKRALNEDITKNIKSYKIPKISQSREINSTSCSSSSCGSTSSSSNEAMIISINEEKRKSPSPVKMPILEPQIDLNFEIARIDSERDSSRSPPVITKQEETLNNVVNSTIKIEDKINLDKIESIEKQRENEAVSFADIVSQLAYHEKATIRHRRYCTLCERWFPTSARHRRHLTGYQHRHTELTQRRTVHALFMMFTGKPCPRLLPASIVRSDCLPGEPTPLQIAVQDVAISLEDGARVKPSKEVSEKDE